MLAYSGRPLEPDQEQDIARRIVALETDIRAALAKVPPCAKVLSARGGRVGRTRAAAVGRIEAALAAEVTDPAHKQVVKQAKRSWAEAQDLRWRLAVSATRVAYREAHRLASNPVLSHPDLVQEGMIGLLEAAKRFEPDRGIRFATYARWWARANMTRAIDLARLVHLSAGASEQLRNLRKLIQLRERAGTAWTARDLAEELGLEVERVRTLLGIGTTQSLDDQPSESGETAQSHQLADESILAPDEQAARGEDLDRLRAALLTALPARERHIVTHRYGIGREARTLTQIAGGMKLSRERVRQLERSGLDLLRDACERHRGSGARTR